MGKKTTKSRVKINRQQQERFGEEAKKHISLKKHFKLYGKIVKAKTKEDVFKFTLKAVRRGIDGQSAYQIARSVLTQKELDAFTLKTIEVPERKLSKFKKRVSSMLHHTSDRDILDKALSLEKKEDIYLFVTKNMTNRFETHNCFNLMNLVMDSKEMKGFFISSDQAHSPVIGHIVRKAS